MDIQSFIDYSEGILSDKDKQKFEDFLLQDPDLYQNYEVFCQVNRVMRARFDLEDVANDPALEETDLLAKQSVEEFYMLDSPEIADEELFIRNQVTAATGSKNLFEDINEIEQEIRELSVDEVSEGWIKDWLQENKEPASSEKDKEFIRSHMEKAYGLKPDKPGIRVLFNRIRSNKVYRLTAISGLAAAALLAGILIINSLIPADPEVIYSDFYQPFSAFSPVTRSIGSTVSQLYTEAVEFYKEGQYRKAASEFSEIISSSSDFIPAYFFGGISQMELGDYDRAIINLNKAAENSTEYHIEARWYLGLCYLQTNNKEKAISCFQSLTGNDGFYRERAEKILKRLK